MIDIHRVSPTHPDVTSLLVQLGAHNAELHGSTDLDHSFPETWTVALIAYVDTAPAALMGLCPTNQGDAVRFVRLFVTPEARGRGIASLLAAEAIDAARAAGYKLATWETGIDKAATMHLSATTGASAIHARGPHAEDSRVRCFTLALAAS